MSISQPLRAPAAGSLRWRLERAIAGDPIDWPVFAVYDWFVENRPWVDWPSLFALWLGQINHADLVRYRRPHVEVVETTTVVDGGVRRDVRWMGSSSSATRTPFVTNRCSRPGLPNGKCHM